MSIFMILLQGLDTRIVGEKDNFLSASTLSLDAAKESPENWLSLLVKVSPCQVFEILEDECFARIFLKEVFDKRR